MPLPLLIPLAIGASAAYGAGKTVKAASDSSLARSINANAKKTVDQANSDVEEAKEHANIALETLGKKKLEALERNLEDFVSAFALIKNVEVNAVKIDSDHQLNVDQKAPEAIANDCHFLVQSGRGVLAGATSGSLTAFGAYSGTMLLASSGTGTAISSLSGAAATNATLAWLGGGTLASGGLGVAGGTMVLGTLVAGPALLVFGSVLGAKASKSLNDAKSNRERADTFKEACGLTVSKLSGIAEIADFARRVLSKIRGRLRRATADMKSIQQVSGFDYSSYAPEEQEAILKAVKYAQLLRVLIDTPLLSEDGEVLRESQHKFEMLQVQLT